VRIAIISPYTLPVNRGNSLTAERIKNGLIQKGMTISIFDSSCDSVKDTAEFNPDIVHCLHGTRSHLFISELYHHISAPLVTTLTGTDYNNPEKPGTLSEKLSYMPQKSSAIITFNSFAKELLLEIFPAFSEKVHVIPQAVELMTWNESRNSIRNKYEYTEKDIIILLAGGIRSIKNLDYAIDACFEIEKQNNHIKLILAGPIIEQDNADHILDKGKELKCFSYLGELSQHETRRLMYGSDIFLNTSISEGMSGAILEAMAESLPVIATRNSGNDALVDNNESGFLVPLNDQDDLIEKLLRLISDKALRDNMGAKGKGIIEKNYLVELEIDRLLMIYKTTGDNFSK
jgi:glycosyltransferase involved in cell wall biosynthesis